MSLSTEAISLEKLHTAFKQLQAENKTLLADNPKRLKKQIKRLQEENRAKNAEIDVLKSRLKHAQPHAQQYTLEEQVNAQETLKISDEPYWESEDKSWAIYLDPDQETTDDQQPGFNLRVLDRKTGCAKIPHMSMDADNQPAVAWPRMRAISKEVKEKIENIVGLS